MEYRSRGDGKEGIGSEIQSEAEVWGSKGKGKGKDERKIIGKEREVEEERSERRVKRREESGDKGWIRGVTEGER